MSSVLPSLSESVGLRQERMERPRTGVTLSSVLELTVSARAGWVGVKMVKARKARIAKRANVMIRMTITRDEPRLLISFAII
jgi:hypothetical protein